MFKPIYNFARTKLKRVTIKGYPPPLLPIFIFSSGLDSSRIILIHFTEVLLELRSVIKEISSRILRCWELEERQRDRDREREREKERERGRQGQADIHTDRDRDIGTDRQTYRQTDTDSSTCRCGMCTEFYCPNSTKKTIQRHRSVDHIARVLI